jgi:hypothetical protein
MDLFTCGGYDWIARYLATAAAAATIKAKRSPSTARPSSVGAHPSAGCLCSAMEAARSLRRTSGRVEREECYAMISANPGEWVKPTAIVVLVVGLCIASRGTSKR